MADAAIELERTPTPRVEEPKVQVIPNAQAFDLMMLADLSVQQPRGMAMQNILAPYHQPQKQEPPPPRAATPPTKQEFTQQVSPLNAPPPMLLPSQAAHSSPVKASPLTVQPVHGTSHSEANGFAETSRNIVPARVSTHRIMDILNNDQDVPTFRSRESQPPPQAPSQAPPQEPSTPSRREAVISQHNTPSHGALPAPDVEADLSEQPVDQALMDALGGRPSEPPSPLPNHQPWQRQSAAPPPQAAPSRDSEDVPRRKDPLQKIRELLDRKAREHGREPPDRSHYRFGAPFLPRMSSMQAAQERQDVAGYDPTRPSAGLYGGSSSAAPSYPPAGRRDSQDQGASHWDRDRRMSVSQAPPQPNQSPYSNPPQLHQGDHSRTGRTPPSHQSPYALPPGSLPLPPKPSGPPPPTTNFRFAHYDPAPPRPSYPPTSPTYPPGSHPPQLGLGPPPYAPGYPPSYQSSYVPPVGSFQAPPPPPSNLAPYPPLKIHQYGGQPILPASMAPIPRQGLQMAFHGQQQPQQQAPPPPPSAYSPPQQNQQPPRPQYEPHRESQPAERPPEPQQRPRRQYRSYHAPGTQFRNYQGPVEGRRRGG